MSDRLQDFLAEAKLLWALAKYKGLKNKDWLDIIDKFVARKFKKNKHGAKKKSLRNLLRNINRAIR